MQNIADRNASCPQCAEHGSTGPASRHQLVGAPQQPTQLFERRRDDHLSILAATERTIFVGGILDFQS